MAKNGLLYYNTDTDRYDDIRIKKLKKRRGLVGIATYDYLLCQIYKDRGYYVECDDDFVFLTADFLGIEENELRDIIDECADIGLFCKTHWQDKSILTSESIQERYIKACKYVKRVTPTIESEINLIEVNVIEQKPNVPEQSPDVQEQKPNVPEHEGQKDTKGYKKEEEKENVKKKDAAVAATNDKKEVEVEEAVGRINLTPPKQTIAEMQAARKKREKVFYDSLVQYVEQYGRDMIRAFFDYWSEPNKSGTKMRFEMQPTFELSRRLATWARRNESQTPIHNGNGITTPTTKQRNPKFADFGETMEAIRLGIGAGLAERDNLAGDGQ